MLCAVSGFAPENSVLFYWTDQGRREPAFPRPSALGEHLVSSSTIRLFFL